MPSKVSVIITTRNSGATLDTLLKSIKDQTYPNIETVVVDNSSSDDTVRIAKSYTGLVFQKGPERSAQRNFGAEKSHGQYYLFLDSDMVLTKDVIEECVKAIEKNKDGVEYGGVVIPEKSFGKGIWAKAKAFEREINEGEVFFEAARFFSKKVFYDLKGYDESLTGPEDWDFPQMVAKKYKIARAKSLILHNEGKLNLFKLAKKKYYYGLKAHQYLIKQEKSVFSPTTVYFLRPAFYRSWRKILSHPVVSSAMFFMLFIELLYGGIGYLKGRFFNGK